MAELTISRAESSTLSSEGRVVIPAGIRKQLGLEPGVTLSFRVEGNRVLMSTRETAIAELQRLFGERPRVSPTLASDELIAERRAEAAKENLEGS